MDSTTLANTALRAVIAPDGTVSSIFECRDGYAASWVKPDGRLGEISYTLISDDITKGKKLDCTPYMSRYAAYDKVNLLGNTVVCQNEQLGVTTTYAAIGDGLTLSTQTDNANLSQFGLSLPFNFMGTLNGGGYKNQFLPLSPYISEDGSHQLFYFSRVNGNPIAVIVESEADGYKLDYSPYVFGHYFVGMQIFATFDRAFKPQKPKSKRLRLHVLPVSDYVDALKKLAALKNIPVAYTKITGGLVGDVRHIEVFGACDALTVSDKSGTRTVRYENPTPLNLNSAGITSVTPYRNGVAGADCRLYAYTTNQELYKKSMLSVSQSDLDKTDGNLCEHQSWAAAALRYLMRFEGNDGLIRRVKSLLDVVTEPNPDKAVTRQTICRWQQDKIPPFNTYQSDRLQEVFAGVGILVDAWRFFGQSEYLEFAVDTMTAMMQNTLQLDGEIRRTFHDANITEDYTTVTCLMLYIVDLVIALRQIDDDRADYFAECADKIADFVHRRGMHFPTEGGASDLAEEQMEEGSISCSALTLLYYCAHIRYDKQYIDTARRILHLHESWQIPSINCNLNGSTLRWWETLWEGDADGPALCCGHAWTIWRAEADFWYAILEKDTQALLRSYNGFMSNYAKIQDDGSSYAVYQPEFITGGGFANSSDECEFRVKRGFPKQTDSGLSRYVFSRAADTWLYTAAIIHTPEFSGVLNAQIKDGWLYPDVPGLKYLFVDGYRGKLTVAADVTVISNQNFTSTKNANGITLSFDL